MTSKLGGFSEKRHQDALMHSLRTQDVKGDLPYVKVPEKKRHRHKRALVTNRLLRTVELAVEQLRRQMDCKLDGDFPNLRTRSWDSSEFGVPGRGVACSRTPVTVTETRTQYLVILSQHHCCSDTWGLLVPSPTQIILLASAVLSRPPPTSGSMLLFSMPHAQPEELVPRLTVR